MGLYILKYSHWSFEFHIFKIIPQGIKIFLSTIEILRKELIIICLKYFVLVNRLPLNKEKICT